jgi:alkaline phosphatase D
VVLSGDWHCAGAMTLHKTPGDKSTPRIGHEFAGTSIGSGCPWARDMRAARDANPHVVHHNGDQRGYLRCTAEAANWTATYRVVEDSGIATSKVSTDIELRTGDL